MFDLFIINFLLIVEVLKISCYAVLGVLGSTHNGHEDKEMSSFGSFPRDGMN